MYNRSTNGFFIFLAVVAFIGVMSLQTAVLGKVVALAITMLILVVSGSLSFLTIVFSLRLAKNTKKKADAKLSTVTVDRQSESLISERADLVDEAVAYAIRTGLNQEIVERQSLNVFNWGGSFADNNIVSIGRDLTKQLRDKGIKVRSFEEEVISKLNAKPAGVNRIIIG